MEQIKANLENSFHYSQQEIQYGMSLFDNGQHQTHVGSITHKLTRNYKSGEIKVYFVQFALFFSQMTDIKILSTNFPKIDCKPSTNKYESTPPLTPRQLKWIILQAERLYRMSNRHCRCT